MKKTAYSRFLARAAVTLLAVFSFSGARAQEIVTIGEDTGTTYYFPIDNYFNYSCTQQIYTAEEIGIAGTIEAVSFYYNYGTAYTASNVTMYMKNVERSDFSSTTDCEALAPGDIVWTGSIAPTEAGWYTFTLDTPFEYDGTSNLLVAFFDGTSGYPGTSYTWRQTTSPNSAYMALRYYSDSNCPDPYNLSSYDGSKQWYTYRSNIQIVIEPAASDCPKPKNLAASNVTAHTAELSWESDGTAFILQYKKATDSNWTEKSLEVNENPYTLTGLAPETEYQVRVQAHSEGCGTDPETGNDIFSDYREITFTTLESCVTPTDLAASNVTAYEATITWTSDADAWQICVNNDEENLIDVTENTYTLTELTPQTTYTVKVRTNCGNEYSNWKTMSFTTACGAVTTFPWSDDFESYEASGQGITFNNPCWVNEHISGNGSYFFEVYSGTTGGNSTKQLRLHDMSSGTMTKLMLPEMTLPGDNYMFSIDVYRSTSDTGYSGEGIRVFVSTDGDIERATELAFISRNYTTSDGNLIPAESAQGWYTYEIPLGISGTCYIILRGESKYGSATYMDNFAVMQVPSCMKPTRLTASDVTKHTATIGWTSEATEWVVAYKAAADEDFTEVPAVTENPYTLTGLAAETAYTVKVRTNCGGGDYSNWTAPVNFTTAIAAPVPTNVVVSNVTNKAATVSWVSEATSFNVQYKATNAEEWQTATTTENSITITGLTPETEYQVQVQGDYGELDGLSEWTAAANFTTIADNAVPVALTASNITATTATVSWTGYGSDSYNVTLGTPDLENSFNVNVDFNSGIPADWTNDATYPWALIDDGNGGYYIKNGNTNVSSSTSAISVTATYPTDGTIAFDAECRGEGLSTFYDHCDFIIDDQRVFYHGSDLTNDGWNNYSFEVPAGAHTFTWSYTKDNSVNADGDYFAVDNVVMNAGAISWNAPVSTDQEEYTFEGLTPNTQYLVKVEGVLNEELSGETNPIIFTTNELIELANDDSQADAEGKNSAIIAANDTKVADVKLAGRTLYKDGEWNTICLPFDLVLEGSPLWGATAKTLTNAEVTDNGEYTHVELTFGDDVTTLQAGVPYIIKWEASQDHIVDPTFTGVLIKDVDEEVRTLSFADNQVKFIGYYNAFTITADDTGIYYMTAGNELKATGIDRTLKSCRAYFQFSEEASKARQFVLNFGDGNETTGIISTKNSPDSVNDGWYTVNGMKLDKQPKRKGVYIQNGRKVVIK